MRFILIIALLCLSLIRNDSTIAAVTKYTDQSQWEAAAGRVTTITFTELPASTWIGEQYANLGVHFTDGSDQVYQSNSFLSDGSGLNGAFDNTTLTFDSATTTLALLFPGTVQVKLYSKGTLIYSSPTMGGGGPGFFRGLISTEPFDKAVLHDGGLFVDNLYFGPPIKTPGDATGDGFVNIDDILAVINGWGACPKQPEPCPGDVGPPIGHGFVNIDDLLAVINNWTGK